MSTPERKNDDGWQVGIVSPGDSSSPPRWIRYNEKGKMIMGEPLTESELAEQNVIISKLLNDFKYGRREKSKKVSELRYMTELEVNNLINNNFLEQILIKKNY